MRKIERTARFKKDYKKLKKGRHGKDLDSCLTDALQFLIADAALPARYRDHQLTGTLKDFRDCHLKPDIVLIYRKSGDDVLQLVRVGTHSDLF